MTPSRFQQIERLYHAARERAASERAGFLDRACSGDDELRRQVESLLAQDISATNALEHGAWESAASSNTDDAGAPALAAGSEIGSYKIEGPIGEGGMGVVYKALDTRLNRPVAVKLLSDRLADAAARRRFQREAQTASSLNHPHILKRLTLNNPSSSRTPAWLTVVGIAKNVVRYDWPPSVPRILLILKDKMAEREGFGLSPLDGIRQVVDSNKSHKLFRPLKTRFLATNQVTESQFQSRQDAVPANPAAPLKAGDQAPDLALVRRWLSRQNAGIESAKAEFVPASRLSPERDHRVQANEPVARPSRASRQCGTACSSAMRIQPGTAAAAMIGLTADSDSRAFS